MQITRPSALVLAAVVALSVPAAAQTPAQQTQAHATGATPRVQAVPRSEPIAVDGRLSEGIWQTAAPAADFRQQDPNEGQPATQRTEIRLAYDHEALYIGAGMFYSLGAEGVHSLLARRDQNPGGDYLQFVFDTYHDHTGRTVFTINPAGVKNDAGQASAYADPSWDPVYSAVAHVDPLGWKAQLK